MKLRIAGAEVHLSIGLLPLILFFIVIGEVGKLTAALFALLLHELAHWISARNLGYAVSGIKLYPFGAVMDLVPVSADQKQEWIAALAGPLASFVTASAVKMVCAIAQIESEWIETFQYINLVISVVNMLPAYPLDGGRIARNVLLTTCRKKTADRISVILTVTISSAMLGYGILLLTRGIPAWMMLSIPPFLAASAVHECRDENHGAIGRMLERNASIRAGNPQKAQFIVLYGDTTIGEAIAKISYSHYTVFRIRTTGAPVEIDEDAILNAASVYGYQTKLKQLILFDRAQIPCYNNMLNSDRTEQRKNGPPVYGQTFESR